MILSAVRDILQVAKGNQTSDTPLGVPTIIILGSCVGMRNGASANVPLKICQLALMQSPRSAALFFSFNILQFLEIFHVNLRFPSGR
jgi:hypothetical protein